MAYRRVVLSLANVIAVPEQLVSRDAVLREIIIFKMPANTVIALHFGDSADPVNISDPVTFQPDGDEAQAGLYWTNPTAQAGVTVEMIVVTGTHADSRNKLNGLTQIL